MMAKIGRNDPCPCGSGQKYKRCCGPRDDAAAAERTAADRTAAVARQTPRFAPETAIGGEDDSLDEAEHAAQDLLERYPAVHDGLERLAMVAAARGDRLRAAEYYRKAADFVHAHADQYARRWRSTCERGRPNSAHLLAEGSAGHAL
jgi:SEC-C motif